MDHVPLEREETKSMVVLEAWKANKPHTEDLSV